ncbi:MAG: 8-amino-7-oxononanoate synthetase [Candidatus Woesebacteria bacterium GW2011_GWA1_37_8]|uniref:8-amino-7-oxononanoate synthetase n=3 Tax=Candidatus Woeseibacteriota TaxID=1752722 RepID=A0A0G0HT06_9BACT|nr:MAG: pyridoxal phosphate-dependent acyltransferase, glycine C-acetyltransferase [Microgenomates group bacterium GW2011_GWC1_37_12b]KKQ46278.1 MAG: 8-amino-7-oxononanoate synthetase [Candidatus Woesebacteria bacterium GW2011_GWA1_37_8]
MSKYSWFTDSIQNLQDEGFYNTPRIIDSPIGAEILIGGKKYLNFASNNYLGFANDPRLIRAAKSAIEKYGIGPAAVRTIAGTTTLHQELEKRLAEFKKVDDVVVFQSGFTANLAVIPTIAVEGDLIFSDELNHASIIDACRLSKAEVVRYLHLNSSDLEEKLKKAKNIGKKIIVTDGVFSMDGDIAPLPELAKLAQKYEALLIVDDAHGEGVLGKNGRGVVDHFGLHGKVDIEVGTLSKAFGVVGGFAGGKKEIIAWLRQRARPFLFSSALTIPDTAAAIEAVKILSSSDKPVKKLWENTKFFKSELKKLKFDIGTSTTPIIPLMIGDEKKAKEVSRELFERGLFSVAITYPTVAKGKARIRLMNSAAHSKSQVKKAVETISAVGKLFGVI